jgi:hypothetical protein
MGGARDVACYENVVGDDTINVEGTAAGVAGDTPEPGGQSCILQPFGIADRSERRQNHIDLKCGSVGEAGAPHVAARVSFKCCYRNASAEVYPMRALDLRGNRADHTAERPGEGRRGALGDGHLESEFPANRGHLRADETRTDNQHVPRPCRQPLLEAGRIIARAECKHAV